MSDGQIDYSKRQPGKLCEDCKKEHTHVLEVENGFAKHYCTEHWPGSKNDWRHEALKKHYLKAMKELYTIDTSYQSLSEYEKCMTYIRLKGGTLTKKA